MLHENQASYTPDMAALIDTEEEIIADELYAGDWPKFADAVRDALDPRLRARLTAPSRQGSRA